MPSGVAALVDALARQGIDAGAIALAWARAIPSVILVPAFGLRALPPPARAVLGLAFAASIFPALTPIAGPSSEPWMLRVLAEAVRGLPIALAAAVPLWAATMAGGLADALRGAQDVPSVPVVEDGATPLGVPLSLLGSAVFLAGGGPARVVEALATNPGTRNPIARAAHDLTAGVSLAVALGGPLLAASVIVEIAGALVSRAASPAQLQALLAPLRALGALAVMALVFDRLASALVHAVAGAP